MKKKFDEKNLNHEAVLSSENDNFSKSKRLDLNDLLKRNKDIKKSDNLKNLLIITGIVIFILFTSLIYISLK
tara:strand:+ start:276 stop:491 length:216 start_codon:yes stop_codon:yes gene_type:complete